MFSKIMVCLDGSPLSEQILPYAAEQALKFNSQLVLFRAYQEPTIISVATPGFPGVPIETTGMVRQVQKEEKEAAEYLKTIADQLLTGHQLKAECVTVLGPAGQTIVKYAREKGVELITIATHGRSGLGRVVMGSVADYVLRQTGIPILLIRPGKPSV